MIWNKLSGMWQQRVLLAKDDMEQTVWHVAAKVRNSDVSEKLWGCAIQRLTSDELNNKLLLAKDVRECTAWHVHRVIRENMEVGQKESNPQRS